MRMPEELCAKGQGQPKGSPNNRREAGAQVNPQGPKAADKNSFDEVRVALAFIVLFAHTQVLSGTSELTWLTKYFDSNIAVKGFFAISGYLVTKSFYSSSSIYEYFEKRIRRIAPAYILVVFYCVIIGIFYTDNTSFEFFTNSRTYTYILANLSFLNFLQPTLPGVFSQNSMSAMNGSLWTIKIELMLYFTVPFLIIGYAKFGAWATFLVTFALGALWYTFFQFGVDHALGPTIARQFPGQLPYFAFGSALGFVAMKTGLSRAIIVLGLLYFVFRHSALDPNFIEYSNMIVLPLFVIVLAKSKYLNLGIGKVGDLSYGIYLFHFPTIQALADSGIYSFNAYAGLFLSIIITLTLSWVSWHIVEKHFLKRSSHYVKAST